MYISYVDRIIDDSFFYFNGSVIINFYNGPRRLFLLKENIFVT